MINEWEKRVEVREFNSMSGEVSKIMKKKQRPSLVYFSGGK